MSITEAEATITAALRYEISNDSYLMFEARGWITDCTGQNAAFWPAVRVLDAIALNYDGGLLSFQINSN